MCVRGRPKTRLFFCQRLFFFLLSTRFKLHEVAAAAASIHTAQTMEERRRDLESNCLTPTTPKKRLHKN